MTVNIELSVVCYQCGGALDATFRVSKTDAILEIAPCDSCISQAEESARLKAIEEARNDA